MHKLCISFHKLCKVRHGLLQIATGITKCDTAYYNCHGTRTVHDLLLKFWNTFQTISNSSYRPLTSLNGYTRKLICILTFFESPHNTFCLFSNLLKFLFSKALQEIFSPPNSLAERGQTASVLWGTQIIAQGAPKIFLSTCPSDKHYFKFGCPKPKGSCPKSFAQNSKTIGHIFYCLLSHNQPLVGKLTGLVTKARFLSQMELVKKQMIEMAEEWRSFKGIFNLILTSMRFAFMTIT